MSSTLPMSGRPLGPGGSGRRSRRGMSQRETRTRASPPTATSRAVTRPEDIVFAVVRGVAGAGERDGQEKEGRKEGRAGGCACVLIGEGAREGELRRNTKEAC
jgi:hypothetical protein